MVQKNVDEQGSSYIKSLSDFLMVVIEDKRVNYEGFSLLKSNGAVDEIQTVIFILFFVKKQKASLFYLISIIMFVVFSKN